MYFADLLQIVIQVWSQLCSEDSSVGTSWCKSLTRHIFQTSFLKFLFVQPVKRDFFNSYLSSHRIKLKYLSSQWSESKCTAVLNSRSQLSSLGRAPTQPQPQLCWIQLLQLEPQLNSIAWDKIVLNQAPTQPQLNTMLSNWCNWPLLNCNLM